GGGEPTSPAASPGEAELEGPAVNPGNDEPTGPAANPGEDEPAFPPSLLGKGAGGLGPFPDPKFAELPALVIVDAGEGALSAALEALWEVGVTDIPVIALAKEHEEIFRPGEPDPLVLPRNSQALYLVQRIRDEAHRFAITYHRKVRTKQTFDSLLDSVPGVGPRRKQQLLRRFGSVKAIREATLNELAATPGMTRAAAEKIKELI